MMIRLKYQLVPLSLRMAAWSAAAALLLAACSPIPSVDTPTPEPEDNLPETGATQLVPTDVPLATEPPASIATEPPASTATSPAPTAAPTEAAPEPAFVNIQGSRFSPASITVSAGTTVTWRHQGSGSHTITADDGAFNSGSITAGETFSFTFTTPGEYGYYCEFHGSPGGGGMAGVVIVTP
jgi:plastocyanin